MTIDASDNNRIYLFSPIVKDEKDINSKRKFSISHFETIDDMRYASDSEVAHSTICRSYDREEAISVVDSLKRLKIHVKDTIIQSLETHEFKPY